MNITKKIYKYLDSLNEGTWAVPNTAKKAKQFQLIMKKPLTKQQAKDKLWNIIGDDGFYDAMDDAIRDNNTDVRRFIKSWIKENWFEQERDWFVEWDDKAVDILSKAIKKKQP